MIMSLFHLKTGSKEAKPKKDKKLSDGKNSVRSYCRAKISSSYDTNQWFSKILNNNDKIRPLFESINSAETPGTKHYSKMAQKIGTVPSCSLTLVKSPFESSGHDSTVLIAPSIKAEHLSGSLSQLLEPLQQYKDIDDAAEREISLHYVPDLPSKKLIYSPIGPLERDYDDIRRVFDASNAGIKRAISSGSRKPLLSLPGGLLDYKYADLVSILGALHALYVPLEVRESSPSKKTKAEDLGITNFPSSSVDLTLKLAQGIESGKIVCRDIGGSDPERMAAPNVAQYVQDIFSGTAVKVDVIDDGNTIDKEFPLLGAVNRSAKGVERHRGRVILLTYEPDDPVDTTLLLVGKGVTYDTGGADIKAGGVMAGMHRDKCGAAAVAGFFQTLAQLKPKGIKVIGGMAMVRNSVGSDCYVSDEIITSRAGVRVRVGNTDAEGRMAMTDLLCLMKEKAVKETNPYLFTIATLTGHAVLTVGSGYSIIMDNGPARKEKLAEQIQKAGDSVGDMFEISTLRREDYNFVKGKSEYEDLLQCNNAPSSRTPRGHQFPAAFMILASGLDKHGNDSSTPLRYSHIDIAAADGPFPGIPSGSPVAALVAQFLFRRV